jgi:hypothetical protein
MSLSDYDSTNDTFDHIAKVRRKLDEFRDALGERARLHDRSKLESPEKEVFDAVTPKLKALTYGSDEYKAALAEMGDALKHHYAHNSHHPEHYENGVDGMDLLDLIELFCDWKAASERLADGDFGKSLAINKERFGLSDQLASVFENTRVRQGW